MNKIRCMAVHMETGLRIPILEIRDREIYRGSRLETVAGQPVIEEGRSSFSVYTGEQVVPLRRVED